MNRDERRRLNIGIVCYPTPGGSGTVAVELAHSLARRGHNLHVISYSVPMRLDTLRHNLRFHVVHVPDYPLFEFPPYSLALAAQIAEVSCRFHLDVLHVHYAIPHAVSGWLARRISGRFDMPLITTLHGTDITIIGQDSSYLPVTRFSLEASDIVTVVSEWLRGKVDAVVHCGCDCEVVYNFVDSERFHPRKPGNPPPFTTDPDVPVLMHVSNFRPVKRVLDVVEVFLRVREQMPAQLVLVGDGPDSAAVERQLEQSPFHRDVISLGTLQSAEGLLPWADVFLLPSDAESFGLAALEAQACGVPVIGCNAGGLPEVIRHGETGFLFAVGDVSGMTDACLRLFRDRDLMRRVAAAARVNAERFRPDTIVDRYEDLYWRAILDLHAHDGEKLAAPTSPCADLIPGAP